MYTDREGETERDPSSEDSLPKWPSQPKLSQSEARNLSFLQVLGVGTEAQALGLSFIVFPATLSNAGLEMEQPNQDLTQHSSGMLAAQLATPPQHWP